MTVIHTEDFEFEGHAYKIVVTKQAHDYHIKAYKGTEEANGYEYTVRETIAFDLWAAQGVSGVQHMIDLAKEDVRHKRWESVLQAVKTLEEEKKTAAR